MGKQLFVGRLVLHVQMQRMGNIQYLWILKKYYMLLANF
jgi:hypothetical protein